MCPGGRCHIGGMAERESWTVDLRCPTCGTAGEAVVSQDEHPFMQAAGTLRVDRIPDDFRVRKLGDRMRTTEFGCTRRGGLTQAMTVCSTFPRLAASSAT